MTSVEIRKKFLACRQYNLRGVDQVEQEIITIITIIIIIIISSSSSSTVSQHGRVNIGAMVTAADGGGVVPCRWRTTVSPLGAGSTPATSSYACVGKRRALWRTSWRNRRSQTPATRSR